MSNLNIKRAVDNIRSGTSVYTPITEVVVNAIQAIEETENSDGLVEIRADRVRQANLDDSAPEINGFTVIDNGVGFTDEHRESFDTLYTAHKIQEGGKGFGRFTCLKYYEDVNYISTYHKDGSFYNRSFSMGKEKEIIVDEGVTPSHENSTGTTVKLSNPIKNFPEKSLPQIARRLVEKLLPYFISDKGCPKVVLAEQDGSDAIVLNEYLGSGIDALIVEVKKANGEFLVESNSLEPGNEFFVQTFKIYSPATSRSRISLVAHRREVTATSLHQYIPEFSEEFFDNAASGERDKDRNFIVVSYVTGSYLDKNVSLERGGFDFPKEKPDMVHYIAQRQIEEKAAIYSQKAVDSDVEDRKSRKISRIEDYVRDNAPWHRQALTKLDYSSIPHNPSPSQIDSVLHQQEYREEARVKGEVRKLLADDNVESLKEKAGEIARQVSDRSKNELAHYISLRKSVLDIFEKSLERGPDGKYSAEDVVHDIIFPVKKDSDQTPFRDHNLWIIDERLNFTEYLSSDKELNGPNSDRPDILAYDKRIGFRGGNEASNPVTIFEFKKPQRDDFVNPSSKEDPVEQIIRYVNQIRKGKYKTPKGRKMQIEQNTPFYGYVICELNQKVEDWLEEIKDFKPLPDRLGYFKHHGSANLYIEVWSWDKALNDARMRNRVFFEKLGIS
ncbi:ATP-binding protein [Neptunicella marina]|uniref:ATP-binding protein n=1 Tax=Neptunicella marina TaxID=2125989 RepID=A0A8J6M012_9ALTE|nr:ATP-binding protein [Neptunicella marina]MBC3764572.1 ATP-binding protein [Neptunicella marina]